MPLFAAYFFAGLVLSLLLAAVRLASFRVPWLVILAPLAAGWICATWPWVRALAYWPGLPWSNLVLIALLSVVAACLLRLVRGDRNSSP